MYQSLLMDFGDLAIQWVSNSLMSENSLLHLMNLVRNTITLDNYMYNALKPLCKLEQPRKKKLFACS